MIITRNFIQIGLIKSGRVYSRLISNHSMETDRREGYQTKLLPRKPLKFFKMKLSKAIIISIHSQSAIRSFRVFYFCIGLHQSFPIQTLRHARTLSPADQFNMSQHLHNEGLRGNDTSSFPFTNFYRKSPHLVRNPFTFLYKFGRAIDTL